MLMGIIIITDTIIITTMIHTAITTAMTITPFIMAQEVLYPLEEIVIDQ
jgi:hypothetical protein